MNRALRWVRNALLGVAATLILAIVAAYVASERIVRRTYEAPGTPVVVPQDSVSIHEGERLAKIHGCIGCHGEHLQGDVLIDNLLLARVVAPNLTVAAREFTDAQLERIIRRGVRPNNRSVVVMPSGMFTLLDDADVARIIAYVRSVPGVAGNARGVRLGPGARVMFALSQFTPAVADVRAAEALSSTYPGVKKSMARGAYLVRTSCTECHGLDLRGDATHPDLRIAAGYSREAFRRFMRTGKALGERELTTMSPVARGRFSLFTDDEVAAVHDYLLARAATPIAAVAK
jgi:mono/diheme cytochrome c family protein